MKKEAEDCGAAVVLLQETRLGKAGGAKRRAMEEAVQRELNKGQYEVAAQANMEEQERGKKVQKEGTGKVGAAILAKKGMQHKQKKLQARIGVEGVAAEIGKVLIRCVYATVTGQNAEELKGVMEEMEDWAQQGGAGVYLVGDIKTTSEIWRGEDTVT